MAMKVFICKDNNQRYWVDSEKFTRFNEIPEGSVLSLEEINELKAGNELKDQVEEPEEVEEKPKKKRGKKKR